MNELKQKIHELTSNNKDYTIAQIAKELDLKEAEVLLNLPKEMASVTDGSNFDEIIKDIENWGEVLVLKVTPSFVFEIKTKISSGTYGHGFYNFSHDAPLSGHLKADDIKHIVFLSAKIMMGMLSHSVLFLDKNGDDIFKIYVARDKQRNFLPEQLSAFEGLKNKYA